MTTMKTFKGDDGCLYSYLHEPRLSSVIRLLTAYGNDIFSVESMNIVFIIALIRMKDGGVFKTPLTTEECDEILDNIGVNGLRTLSAELLKFDKENQNPLSPTHH